MTPNAFLRIHLKLLIAQHGRRVIMEILADLSDSTPEQIEDEVAKLEFARRFRSPKRNKSLDELIAALPASVGQKAAAIAKLGRLFEAKQFLPTLRDAEDFLRRGGAQGKNFKSRREVLSPVIERLCEMPDDELGSLVAHTTDSSNRGDYAILADQLMGKGR